MSQTQDDYGTNEEQEVASRDEATCITQPALTQTHIRLSLTFSSIWEAGTRHLLTQHLTRCFHPTQILALHSLSTLLTPNDMMRKKKTMFSWYIQELYKTGHFPSRTRLTALAQLLQVDIDGVYLDTRSLRAFHTLLKKFPICTLSFTPHSDTPHVLCMTLEVTRANMCVVTMVVSEWVGAIEGHSAPHENVAFLICRVSVLEQELFERLLALHTRGFLQALSLRYEISIEHA